MRENAGKGVSYVWTRSEQGHGATHLEAWEIPFWRIGNHDGRSTSKKSGGIYHLSFERGTS